jgi:alanine dehydrogenase
MTGHFWDPRSPKFFKKEDMKDPGFRISVIADISCDMNGGIPSTIRPTTISDPFYAYNPNTGEEDPEFSRPSNITVMAIDNLPGELPRDASLDFGKQLINNVMHDLLTGTKSPMITRATILEEGRLTDRYSYLKSYLNG